MKTKPADRTSELSAITEQQLREYEKELPLDLRKEVADLKAMREASRIKG